MVAKLSVLDHIKNQHTGHRPLFPKFLHKGIEHGMVQQKMVETRLTLYRG